jgi:hypothetical protein
MAYMYSFLVQVEAVILATGPSMFSEATTVVRG